ncbi:MAG: helix-turn-helix domain-containing protein [Treponema sp.]|nr:helix-turn-helix domain-containing protein [Treponema sp.]
MADYQKCFMENLKYYRKLKGLTQAELAEICDVSNGTIGNIECGITKPSFDLILQLSAALEITPEILFHTSESSNIDKLTTDKFSKEQLKKIKTVLNSSIANVIKSLESV